MFETIFKDLSESSEKMFSAVNFIDFFVHDILDYTMLKNNKSFTKNKQVFDISVAIDEIKMFLEDKAKMKDITIGTDLRGFPSEIAENGRKRIIKSVFTDKKRMQ